MSSQTTGSRRDFLKRTGAAGMTMSLLAGCAGDSDDGESNQNTEGQDGEDSDTSEQDESEVQNVQTGGILRAGTKTDVVSLDPHVATAFQSYQVLENVYEKPIRLDRKMRPYGELVQNYEFSDDGTRMTLELRESVQFHPPVDRELTSADIVYCLDRITDEDTGSRFQADFSPVTNYEADGDYTVVLELDQPYAPLLIKLRNLYVMPEGADESSEYDFSTQPVGTGPFIWSERVQDSYVLIEKFDDYWGTDDNGNQLPYLDGVRFTPNSEASARITNLRTGEFDWISGAPQSQGDQLQNDDELEFSAITHGWMDFLAFNMNESPTGDQNFRQTVSWVLDRETIIQGARFGWAEATQNPIPSTSAWREHISVDEPRDQDFEVAQERLDASEYDGEEVSILVSQPFTEQVDAAEIIQDMASEIGLELVIEREDFSTMLDRIGNGDFQIHILGWLSKIGPDDWFYSQYHSDGADNNMRYSNSDVDDLVTEARRSADGRAARGELYDQTLSIVREEQPMIPLLHNKPVLVYQPYVKNFHQRPDRRALFRDVWMES